MKKKPHVCVECIYCIEILISGHGATSQRNPQEYTHHTMHHCSGKPIVVRYVYLYILPYVVIYFYYHHFFSNFSGSRLSLYLSLSFSFSVRLSYSLLPLGGCDALGRGGGRCFALTLIYYRFVVVVYECTLYLYKTVITPTPRNRCACVVV